MARIAEMSGAVLVAALALVGHACASPALSPAAVKTAEVASTGALPPTVEELKNATYAGLGERLGPVTLADGRWTGAPPGLRSLVVYWSYSSSRAFMPVLV